ncbi:FtsX-like permease family protein [Amycolatopsis aidingensis]|uniref:FtsX-like permease family protein n=1 Tax=Amycolatopsis aidingensis TaxID=2842453 RepID=UPI001C0DAB31|nr:FtsX-like permease family protein [Amycolatopsis aidingensis]
MSGLKDFALGLRLAVGGGRISGAALLRLSMTAVGIALAVALLLLATSIGHLTGERRDRVAATQEITDTRPGVDPLRWHSTGKQVGEDYLELLAVAPTGPAAPVPPGLERLPGPGELVVSPEVANRLATPEGDSIRARLPGTVVGQIGKPGLVDPGDLLVYQGFTPAELEEQLGEATPEEVYGFGVPSDAGEMSATTLLLVAPAAAVLLMPLLIFVTTASRMGAAQRDRRLAGLRLLGLDAKQVRRVAAAESLLGAMLGLVAGIGLFLALRPLIGSLELFGMRFFAADFVPNPVLGALVLLLVPALAVGAALFGLRRTIVEPLGVVRQGRTTRRRMWWRWLLTGAGAVTLACTLFIPLSSRGSLAAFLLVGGTVLLLFGIVSVLPWAVEKLVRALRGGSPSWQFAVRRLQLDSGTPSRVVSGLVVVLAGTILIQGLLASVGSAEEIPARPLAQNPGPVRVQVEQDDLPEVRTRLAEVAEVTGTRLIRQATVGESPGQGSAATVEIGDCAALAARATLGPCSDGDVFYVPYPEQYDYRPGPPPRNVMFLGQDERGSAAEWSIPGPIREIAPRHAEKYLGGTVLATPGALGDTPMPADARLMLYVGGTGTIPELADQVALALRPLGLRTDISYARSTSFSQVENERIANFRAALLTASLFVLVVAALSLLMLAVEQITERRRALAALSAAGVPLSVLGRASLWQTAIPVGVGVVLAVAAGIGLTLPSLRLADVPIAIDATAILGLSAAAVLAVLLVTVLTLPLLRQVTKLDALRAE